MRNLYVALAGILLLNVVFQFVTAGVMIFEDGDAEDAHAIGAGVAHLWPLLMLIFAAVGRLGMNLLLLAIGLLVLVTIQSAIPESDGINVIHPLLALVIAFGAHSALQRARAATPPAAPAGPAARQPGTPEAPAPAPQSPPTPTV